MNNLYARENEAERQRLIQITSRLNEKDLKRQMPNGWSIASKLAHLAFWDQYYFCLLQDWERNGFSPHPTKIDPLNEAVRQLSNAIAPMAVIALVRDAADAIDHKLEELPEELAAAIEAGGYKRILCRAMHRREHLDQIENALK